MVGAIDTSLLTDNAGELATAVGVAGGLMITAYVAAKTFPFIARWIGKIFRASTGGAGS